MTTFIALVLRHALTAVGLNEILTGEEQQRLVGAFAAIVGIVWSIAQKKELRAKLARLVGLVPVLLAAVLLSGCWAKAPVTMHFVPLEGNFLTGDKVRLESIEIDPRLYARGCVAVDVRGGDQIRLALQQDGTSDWLIGRAAPAMLRDVVIAAVSFVGAPWEIVKAMLGVPVQQIEGPSDTHGCGDLFVSED